MPAVLRLRGLSRSSAVIWAALALTTVDILIGGGSSKLPALMLMGPLVVVAYVHLAKRWSVLSAGMVTVILLIPGDGRYTLVGHLPVQLEPYRIFVGILIIGWLIALLVDPRVRARRSVLDRPLALIVIATVGSIIVNPGRVEGVSSYVMKSTSLFACFIIFLYIMVSVVRSRWTVDRLMAIMVVAGCVEAIAAELQRKLGYNIFDHLHSFLPLFTFNGAATIGSTLVRSGNIRATASAGHPIELSATMAMLMPCAAYLAMRHKQKLWWVAVIVLVMGDFAGGSRTGVIGMATVLGIFLWLRPRETRRCWPALLPLFVVVHLFAPGAVGSMIAGFFPKGGLVAQQSTVFHGRHGAVITDTRLSRLGPSLQEFSQHNPLFGEGYGTRIVGYLANGKPNPADNAQVLDDQWLGAFLETGIVGFIGWIWLFARAIRRLGRRAKEEAGTPDGWLPVALAASLAAFAASMTTYDAFGFVQGTYVMFTIVAFSAIVLRSPSLKRTVTR